MSIGTAQPGVVVAGSGLSSAVPYPVGTITLNDIIITYISGQSSTLFTPPVGWFLIAKLAGTGDTLLPSLMACYKYADGTEGYTGNLTQAFAHGNIGTSAWMVAYSGVDLATALDVLPVRDVTGETDHSISSSGIHIANYSTITPGAVIVQGAVSNGAAQTCTTYPLNFIAGAQGSGASSSLVTCYTSGGTVPGVFDLGTFTFSGIGKQVGIAIALRPLIPAVQIGQPQKAFPPLRGPLKPFPHVFNILPPVDIATVVFASTSTFGPTAVPIELPTVTFASSSTLAVVAVPSGPEVVAFASDSSLSLTGFKIINQVGIPQRSYVPLRGPLPRMGTAPTKIYNTEYLPLTVLFQSDSSLVVAPVVTEAAAVAFAGTSTLTVTSKPKIVAVVAFASDSSFTATASTFLGVYQVGITPRDWVPLRGPLKPFVHSFDTSHISVASGIVFFASDSILIFSGAVRDILGTRWTEFDEPEPIVWTPFDEPEPNVWSEFDEASQVWAEF